MRVVKVKRRTKLMNMHLKNKCVKSPVTFTSVGSKLKFIENVNSIETRDTCRNYETNVGKSLID